MTVDAAINIGGLNQAGSMLEGHNENLEAEFAEAVRQTNDADRFILGAGCVISTRTKDAKLMKIKGLQI